MDKVKVTQIAAILKTTQGEIKHCKNEAQAVPIVQKTLERLTEVIKK
jgi:hypothetical protein